MMMLMMMKQHLCELLGVELGYCPEKILVHVYEEAKRSGRFICFGALISYPYLKDAFWSQTEF